MPETEALVLHLVRALYNATDGQPMQWRSLAGVSDAAITAEAMQLAVDNGWLLIERGHSVCLTDEGRRLVEER